MKNIKEIHTAIHNIQCCAMELDEMQKAVLKRKSFFTPMPVYKKKQLALKIRIAELNRELKQLSDKLSYICKNK